MWCLDPKWDTSHLVTGAADNTVRLWDIQTGQEISKIETKSAVRTVNFSFSGNMVCYTTDKQMGYPCEINVVDARTFNPEEPVFKVAIPANGPKVTSMLWGGLDDLLLTGHDNGDLVQWDVKTQKKLNIKSDHMKTIMDMQPSKDGSMFVTASKDHTSMLFDSDTLEKMKTYTTERPVNSASLSPLYDHVVLGGGQDAMDVTTTSTKVGKFESRLFHTIFEEEFGRVKGDSFEVLVKYCYLTDFQVTSVLSTQSSFILTAKATLVVERTDMCEYISLTRLTLTSNSISKQRTWIREVNVNVIILSQFLHRL